MKKLFLLKKSILEIKLQYIDMVYMIIFRFLVILIKRVSGQEVQVLQIYQCYLINMGIIIILVI